MLVIDQWYGDPVRDACIFGRLGMALVAYVRRRYRALGLELEAIASDTASRPDVLVELASSPSLASEADAEIEAILHRMMSHHAFIGIRGNIVSPQPLGEPLSLALLAAYTICTGEAAAFGMISSDEIGMFPLTAVANEQRPLDSLDLGPYLAGTRREHHSNSSSGMTDAVNAADSCAHDQEEQTSPAAAGRRGAYRWLLDCFRR